MAKKKADRMTEISKYLCLILRHKPGIIGGELDEHGYMDVDTLIQGVRERYPEFDERMLFNIVVTDDKDRYTLINGFKHGKIRCNQGHSVKVDLELEERKPPMFLYHGTTWYRYKTIMMHGVRKMSRHHVHLSSNHETAEKVAKRRKGNPLVLCIQSDKMYEDGYKFYLSKNGVWLTDHVPPEYILRTTRDYYPNHSLHPYALTDEEIWAVVEYIDTDIASTIWPKENPYLKKEEKDDDR